MEIITPSEGLIFIILLVISEILPFVQNAQANGILHMLFIVLGKVLPAPVPIPTVQQTTHDEVITHTVNHHEQ